MTTEETSYSLSGAYRRILQVKQASKHCTAQKTILGSKGQWKQSMKLCRTVGKCVSETSPCHRHPRLYSHQQFLGIAASCWPEVPPFLWVWVEGGGQSCSWQSLGHICPRFAPVYLCQTDLMYFQTAETNAATKSARVSTQCCRIPLQWFWFTIQKIMFGLQSPKVLGDILMAQVRSRNPDLT